MALPDPLKFLDDLIADLTQPPGHKFTWYAGGGFPGTDVEAMLRSHGIKVWKRVYPEKQKKETDPAPFFGLTVRKKQAKWAYQLMLTAGVPVRSGQIDGVRPLKNGMPKSGWGSVARPVGLGGIVSELIGGRPKRRARKPRTGKPGRAWPRSRRRSRRK